MNTHNIDISVDFDTPNVDIDIAIQKAVECEHSSCDISKKADIEYVDKQDNKLQEQIEEIKSRDINSITNNQIEELLWH